jgi:hypothetical protein
LRLEASFIVHRDCDQGRGRRPPHEGLNLREPLVYASSMALANVDDTTMTAALAKLVDDRLEAGTFVVLEPDSPDDANYYIQFAFDGGRLFCEAVSNQYLEPPYRLDGEQLHAVENLGWGPPEYEGQNWFRTFQPTSPQDYEQIVRLVHRAFHDVYRLPDTVPITMTTSWEKEDLPPDTVIKFASEGHRSTYALVRRYAGEVFGDGARFDPRRPLIFVQHGSAMVSVAVNPIEIHSSLVECYSWVVTSPRMTDELTHFLLAENYRLPFGGFALDGAGDVVLKYVLLGDTLSEEEFKTALVTITEVADEYDDVIAERFGGYRASDRPRR